jgi:hypothetical protein
MTVFQRMEMEERNDDLAGVDDQMNALADALAAEILDGAGDEGEQQGMMAWLELLKEKARLQQQLAAEQVVPPEEAKVEPKRVTLEEVAAQVIKKNFF